MRKRSFALCFAIFTGLGCARAPSDHASAPSVAPRATFPTKNPIDRIVGPKLVAIGVAPPAARPTHELCRRLAIDILGRGPTPSETKTCTSAASVEVVVDAWMNLPEHEHVERRAFGELVQYDVTRTWYRYIVHADDLVGELAQGRIGYDAFVSQIVIHPALYSRHPDDDWTRVIFALFLGRTARPDEVRAMRPLVSLWSERSVADSKMTDNINGRPARELGFEFCNCEGSPGGCTSRALGATIDLRGTCDHVVSRSPPALVRTIAVGDEASPLPHANATQEKKLLSIGAALAARHDFWEAAVDREMKRYLGWWQTGFKRPETDLPEVRAALSEALAKDKNMRALRRTILTSVLYTMPSTTEHDAGRTLPVWSAGPRKLLRGEAWLDTMGNAIGDSVGECDHRFIVSSSYYDGGVDDTEAEPATAAQSSKAMFVDPSLLRPAMKPTLPSFDYESAARRLGGCGVGNVALRTSTLGFARAESDLAQTLCASGHAIVPGKGGLEDDASALVTRFLARSASPEEARGLANDMRACMKQGACSDRGVALRWLCTRVATSAEFGTY